MLLPDASRLLDLPATTWQALRDRLRAIEFNARAMQPIMDVVSVPVARWRLPMRIWHARNRGDLAAHAMRMLTLQDPITVKQAREVLGDVPLDALLAAGVLAEHEGGGIVSPFLFAFAQDDYILFDKLWAGGDPVMGPAASTQVLVSGSMPATRRAHRALDLGCGAGTLAIVLARSCDVVVATDVNPRAVLLTRVNALMAGHTNVEARQGDTFEPVAGETFDLIVSQPPFVSQPKGAAPATFLYGGRRGDEVGLRVLGGLASHLADGGRALVLMEWMSGASDPPLEVRVRAASSNDLDNLHILRSRPTLDEDCVANAGIQHPILDDDFVAAAIARRDHLTQLGISDLRMMLHVFEKPKGRRAFTSTVPLGAKGEPPLRPAIIDKWIAARDLVARGSGAVLDASVSLLPGVVPGPPDERGTVVAVPPFESCLDLIRVPQMTYKLLTLAAGAPTVREAAARLAAALSKPKEEAEATMAAGASQGLLLGLLELATPGT